MTTSDILRESRVPGTGAVFLLGCFDKRVTLYSQQVRALNLVDAVLSNCKELLSPRGRVAVIGGGAGGMTAAAAFARSGNALEAIHLYERKPDLLHLQSGCRDRYLHPRLYDWPRPGSTERDANLPIMTWTAGPADSVAVALKEGFRACRKFELETRLDCTVTKICPLAAGYAVEIDGEIPQRQKPYDVVLLCVGFGYEIGTEARQATSYWDPFPILGPVRASDRSHRIFISGNGDGGLADLILSAFVHMTHEGLHDFVLRHLSGPETENIRVLLLEIDRQAWNDGDIDLLAQYRRLVVPLMLRNKALMRETAQKLRSDTEIWFHTKDLYVFKRESSILNRFLALLAAVADESYFGGKRIHLLSNVPAQSLPDGTVKIGNQEPFVARFRFQRFGPDLKDNFNPFTNFKIFHDFVHAAPGIQAPKVSAYPLTPDLNLSAWTRFKYPDYERRRHYPTHGKYDESTVGEIARQIHFAYDVPSTYFRMERLLQAYDIAQISRDADNLGVNDDPHLMHVRYWSGMYLACVGRLREGNLIYIHAKRSLHGTQVDNERELRTGLEHQLNGHLDEHAGEIEIAGDCFGEGSPQVCQATICSACRMIAKKRNTDLDRAEDVLEKIAFRVGNATANNPFLGCCYFLQRAKICLRRADNEATVEGRRTFATRALEYISDGKRYSHIDNALGGASESVYVQYLLVCELMARQHLGDTASEFYGHLQIIVRQLVDRLPRQLAFCHFTAEEMATATGVSRGPVYLLGPDGG
ncbi:hypothetical protein [Paraburkholderia sp. BCC1885]|uniref:hypothetical protein n=1 Tax=Paraburkholderia sp. BCC1885 TaxID=2562669 RepID=UPI001183A396|nr:hypothetical protein [Paraburkholderia sp. BCC1885]